MRLDKYLCTATGLSRSQAHRAIRLGEVCVNGLPRFKPAQLLAPLDSVSFQNTPVQLAGHGYWMLHKPAGVICANHDSQNPTVLDLLSPHMPTQGLQVCGRLDKDTTGLVLLTTDGQWNHRITAPKKRCYKHYHAQLAEPLSLEAVKALEQGVLLKGETTPTLPARVNLLSPTAISLYICEGKYHQVKRMLATVGNAVVQLHRQAIGSIELDPHLAPGQFRPLHPHEIAEA